MDVQLSRSTIHIHHSAASFDWNTSDVQVTIGGSNNHLLFFIRKDVSSTSFYLPLDRELKSLLKELAIDHWNEQLKKSLAHQYRTRAFAFGLVALVVLSVVGAITGRNHIAKGLVQAIPFEIEEKIGDVLIHSVLPNHSRVTDDELLKLLGESLEPLRNALPERYRKFKFYISSSSDINAFALPGGHIVFNRGALKVAKSGHEILGVASHELAHVTERHVMRNVLQGAGIFVLLQAFFGDVTGIIAVIADQGAFLMSRNFSRSMETEADAKGFDYLIQAKIDPRGMALFFKHILNQPSILGEAGKKVENALEFLSTHPDTASRITEINTRYERLDEKLKTELSADIKSFDTLQAKLKDRDH